MNKINDAARNQTPPYAGCPMPASQEFSAAGSSMAFYASAACLSVQTGGIFNDDRPRQLTLDPAHIKAFPGVKIQKKNAPALFFEQQAGAGRHVVYAQNGAFY